MNFEVSYRLEKLDRNVLRIFFFVGRGDPTSQMPRGPGTRPRYGLARWRLIPIITRATPARASRGLRQQQRAPSPEDAPRAGRGSNVLKRDKRSITIRHLRRGAFLHYPGASRPTLVGAKQRRGSVLVAAVRAPGRAPRSDPIGRVPLALCPLWRSRQLRWCNTTCTLWREE